MTEQIERRKDTDMSDVIHEKHHQYITTLIEKEQQKIAFRQAVIEKTTASLIWSAIVGLGYAVFNYLKMGLSVIR